MGGYGEFIKSATYYTYAVAPSTLTVTAASFISATLEWDANGKLIRTFPTGHFTAIRLPNGNTITSGKPSKIDCKGGFVTEYSPQGKIVWSLTEEDLERLDIRVLRRLTRSTKIQFHLVPISP